MPDCILLAGVDYSKIVTDSAAKVDDLGAIPLTEIWRTITTGRHKGREEGSTRWVEAGLIWSRQHSAQTLPPWFAWRHYRRLATELSAYPSHDAEQVTVYRAGATVVRVNVYQIGSGQPAHSSLFRDGKQVIG